MLFFNALKDFADGLVRGFSLFLTERPHSTNRPIIRH